MCFMYIIYYSNKYLLITIIAFHVHTKIPCLFVYGAEGKKRDRDLYQSHEVMSSILTIWSWSDTNWRIGLSNDL